MKIRMHINQRIKNDRTGYELYPFIGNFVVEASSCLEAVEMVEASEEFKAIPGAYISGIDIVEKEDLLSVNMKRVGEVLCPVCGKHPIHPDRDGTCVDCSH